MSFEKLTCPHCAYPLDTSISSTRVIVCPRCNDSVELESDCFGSCMSCHHASRAGSCAATSVEPTACQFVAGESMVCVVGEIEKGGYAVEAGTEKLPGFVATNRLLIPGQKIEAVMVCVHKGRLLLAFGEARER